MQKSFWKGSFIFKILLVGVLILPLSAALVQCNLHKEVISYNDHIRPIFNKKCLTCHGGIKQLGDFSLLFEEEVFKSDESEKSVIVRGSPRKSELYRRITHHDPDERMPQDGEPLSTEEKELITKWIDQGAKWEQHWAYIPPKDVDLPALKSDWMTNGIDHFILRKLQENGLQPAHEADRYTLIRRASLDLTGLPPKPEMVDKFIKDESPNAYENMIDRLLASPHFGERWAALWLDLARYADSKGYEADTHRNIWRYRDWVINAFNDDVPFDQFTIEQLAGDLVPDANENQLIATAFNRNSMNNTEGGTEDEEFRIAAVIDRMNTTFEVWQATTLSCVQCHSHPYDPIRHEEFYEVMDIFNHTLDNDLNTEMPNIYSYEKEDAEKIDEIIGFIKQLEPEKRIDKTSPIQARINEALFPKLIPGHCDDFQNVTFAGAWMPSANGIVTNWTSNLQAIEDKKFRFKFSDIDVTDLSHISYTYAVDGNDSRIEVRLDDVDGELINEADFPKTNVSRQDRKKFSTLKTPVVPTRGQHDLIFEIINTTGKIPDGMLSIGSIELHFKGELHTPKLAKYKDELVNLISKADKTPIMQPKSSTFRRTTRVFERGNWLVQGEEVHAKIPESLLTNRAEQTQNRLEFAQWLVSKDNPLTTRVMVNRFWEQIFGTGIIESLEDFGTQSLPASHPELLDWLAVQFIDDHNWSGKALLKQMVSSSAYRQASTTTPEKLEKDPFNRLISRGSRFRLSSEQIRDQALAVSGLLNEHIGGKSVMPHQPDGIWQVVYNDHKWETPKDDLRYRRGLYTYWKRTTPYPSMTAFDSPSREFCVSRRIRTNTPLQALVTLNDPVYLEAAEALGKEMEKAGKENLETGLRAGYRKAMCKEADEATVVVLKKLYRQSQEELKNPLQEEITLSEYENAYEFRISEPMTVVANAIMNLDGFVMKQ